VVVVVPRVVAAAAWSQTVEESTDQMLLPPFLTAASKRIGIGKNLTLPPQFCGRFKIRNRKSLQPTFFFLNSFLPFRKFFVYKFYFE